MTLWIGIDYYEPTITRETPIVKGIIRHPNVTNQSFNLNLIIFQIL